MLRSRAATTIAVTGAALLLGAGSAFAAGGWTVVTAPPTGPVSYTHLTLPTNREV